MAEFSVIRPKSYVILGVIGYKIPTVSATKTLASFLLGKNK